MLWADILAQCPKVALKYRESTETDHRAHPVCDNHQTPIYTKFTPTPFYPTHISVNSSQIPSFLHRGKLLWPINPKTSTSVGSNRSIWRNPTVTGIACKLHQDSTQGQDCTQVAVVEAALLRTTTKIHVVPSHDWFHNFVLVKVAGLQ